VGVENVDLEVIQRDVDLVHVVDRGALVEERLDLIMEQVLLLPARTFSRGGRLFASSIDVSFPTIPPSPYIRRVVAVWS
jgi:hypothetical protein